MAYVSIAGAHQVVVSRLRRSLRIDHLESDTCAAHSFALVASQASHRVEPGRNCCLHSPYNSIGFSSYEPSVLAKSVCASVFPTWKVPSEEFTAISGEVALFSTVLKIGRTFWMLLIEIQKN